MNGNGVTAWLRGLVRDPTPEELAALEAEVARCEDVEKKRRIKPLMSIYCGGLKSFRQNITFISTLNFGVWWGLYFADVLYARSNFASPWEWGAGSGFVVILTTVIYCVFHCTLPQSIRAIIRKPNLTAYLEPVRISSLALLFCMLEAIVLLITANSQVPPELLLSFSGLLASGCLVVGLWSLWVLFSAYRCDSEWHKRGVDGYLLSVCTILLVVISNVACGYLIYFIQNALFRR